MKVGDLVKHYRTGYYGVILDIDEMDIQAESPPRWKVAWGKWGTVSWIYNENLVEVISESR